MPNAPVQATAEGLPTIDPTTLNPFLVGLDGDNRSPRVRYFDDIRRTHSLSAILFGMLERAFAYSRAEQYGEGAVRLIFPDDGIEQIIALSDELSDRLGHLRRAATMLFDDEDTGS